MIWYLSFSAWFISLGIMPSRSIHTVTNGKISFYGWIIFLSLSLSLSPYLFLSLSIHPSIIYLCYCHLPIYLFLLTHITILFPVKYKTEGRPSFQPVKMFTGFHHITSSSETWVSHKTDNFQSWKKEAIAKNVNGIIWGRVEWQAAGNQWWTYPTIQLF